MVFVGVDLVVFDVFDMQVFDVGMFDVVIDGVGEVLVVVFFWGVDCFNCEIVKKVMFVQFDVICVFCLKWFYCNVYEYCELGCCFGLYGVLMWFFFYCGKWFGCVMGWYGFVQFQVVVVVVCVKIVVVVGVLVGDGIDGLYDLLVGGD